MRYINIFDKYVTLNQKKEILLNKLKSDAIRLTNHLCEVFGEGFKYRYETKFYNIDDDVYSDINTKCNCNTYHYDTEFKSSKNILSPYSFKFEIYISESRNKTGGVFMLLKIKKGSDFLSVLNIKNVTL